MKTHRFNFFFLFFLICAFANAQEQKAPAYDTNYYRTYEDRLVVGFFQAGQNYNMQIKQHLATDKSGRSSVNYNADAQSVNGLVFAYDKLAISFAYQTLPQLNSDKKGNTNSSGFGLNIGGDRWQLESHYNHYNWFYDLSTPLYDTSYRLDKPYYQNPTMNVDNVKFKFMYFFNSKKFSYQSAYAATERQLKSAFSPMFVANIYYNNVYSDSSFIPYYIRSYYGPNADVNHLHTMAYSVGGGVTGTLVIYKRFFLNAIFTLGLESQYNQYHHASTDVTNSANYINWASDFRLAFGFNNRNFFATVNVINDVSQYQSASFNASANLKSASFTIGYRFKVREPYFMPSVRSTKLYQVF